MITVALIGSFRQHYDAVCTAWDVFTKAGLIVTSPKGTPIQECGVPFVRFMSDPPEWGNNQIQTVALHRILRAQFVYVVAPEGYIGRTTCYEIGRIIQARRPIYFSESPKDLPIYLPKEHIRTVSEIVACIMNSNFEPQALYFDPSSELTKLEHDLLSFTYREDAHFE